MRPVRIAVLLLCASASLAASELDPGVDPLGGTRESRQVLAADQAFVLSAKISEDGFLVATWRMPAGYYLYRHRFSFSAADGALGDPIIPAGEPRTDEFFGDVEVYYSEVTARARIVRQAEGDVEIVIGYQGCADVGFCYPPQEKRFRFSRTEFAPIRL